MRGVGAASRFLPGSKRYISVGFSPLYGKKKRGLAEVEREEWTANCPRGCAAVAKAGVPQRIGLKAQEKRRLRPRGECVPEPPAMTNAHATIYHKDMRRACPLTQPHISGACYSCVTPSARLWETVGMPDLALIATVAIFIATSVVVAIGKVADYRMDRAGAALLGSAYH